MKTVGAFAIPPYLFKKPFSSFVVMEVILMEEFLLFHSFDGGKFYG